MRKRDIFAAYRYWAACSRRCSTRGSRSGYRWTGRRPSGLPRSHSHASRRHGTCTTGTRVRARWKGFSGPLIYTPEKRSIGNRCNMRVWEIFDWSSFLPPSGQWPWAGLQTMQELFWEEASGWCSALTLMLTHIGYGLTLTTAQGTFLLQQQCFCSSFFKRKLELVTLSHPLLSDIHSRAHINCFAASLTAFQQNRRARISDKAARPEYNPGNKY